MDAFLLFCLMSSLPAVMSPVPTMWMCRAVEKAAEKAILSGGAVDGNTIANEMCLKPPFTEFRDSVKYGCMKLVSDKMEKLLGPWNGKREHGDYSALVALKQKVRLLCPAPVGGQGAACAVLS